MYDENQMSGEVLEQSDKTLSLRSKMAAAKQRNIANNANAVKNAAKVASKSANPYAKAIGSAVNLADKISGGRASQSLGKHLNLVNKLTPGGRIAQAALNKMSESGVADKIGSTVSKNKQSNFGSKKSDNGPSKNLGDNQNSGNESDYTEAGTLSYKATVKLIKTALIVMIPVMVIIMFCNLFISASQIYINSIDLGTADSLSEDKINEKIENSESNWDKDITDQHENLSYNSSVDVYLLNNSNNQKYIQVAKKKYNEADLDELNDFYGNSIYESIDTEENIDMNVVYNFYYKLYYIYHYYNTEKYDYVKLDLPLLMATLSVYTKDRAIIFGSNTIDYDSKDEDYERFDYNKEHNYVSTPTKGEYDIEVLVQHMVSEQAIETCIDSNGKEVKSNILRDNEIGTQVLVCDENQTYQVSEAKFDIDEEKYREFLPEFLENKYFIDNDLIEEVEPDEEITTCSMLVRGDNYYKIVNPQTEKCSVAGFYNNNSWGLEPKFYSNILNLINDAKSHGCNASIISGHRTYKAQKYFYDCYVTKKCNNGNLAAEPGYSNHEYGIAADLLYYPYNQTCLNYYHTNAYKYGLDFPLLYASYPEDWHIEPINIINGTP